MTTCRHPEYGILVPCPCEDGCACRSGCVAFDGNRTKPKCEHKLVTSYDTHPPSYSCYDCGEQIESKMKVKP